MLYTYSKHTHAHTRTRTRTRTHNHMHAGTFVFDFDLARGRVRPFFESVQRKAVGARLKHPATLPAATPLIVPLRVATTTPSLGRPLLDLCSGLLVSLQVLYCTWGLHLDGIMPRKEQNNMYAGTCT